MIDWGTYSGGARHACAYLGFQFSSVFDLRGEIQVITHCAFSWHFTVLWNSKLEDRSSTERTSLRLPLVSERPGQGARIILSLQEGILEYY